MLGRTPAADPNQLASFGVDGRATVPLLFATLSLDVGGAERQIVAVTSELVRRGWPVSIFCFNREGTLSEQVRDAGVRLIAPPIAAEGRASSLARRAYNSFRAALELRWLLKREQTPIVHFFLTEPYLFGAPAALAAGTPIRIMSRREINPEHGRLLHVRRIEARLHRRMTALLGNSRQVIADLRQEGAHPRQLGLIYNGVDLQAFEEKADRRETRQTLGIDKDAVVMIKIANLIDYKGHRDFLASLARLSPAARQNLVVLLVGRDDGAEADLRRQVESLGIAANVRFLGLRRDIPRLLAAADIGVHASHMEGFPNAVLEAMTAGLPMVVTAVGGMLDQVVDGEQGFLVPPRAPESMARALERFLADPDLRRRMGAASRRRVVENFSMAASVDRYEALYRGLLAGKQASEIAAIAPPQA